MINMHEKVKKTTICTFPTALRCKNQ